MENTTNVSRFDNVLNKASKDNIFETERSIARALKSEFHDSIKKIRIGYKRITVYCGLKIRPRDKEMSDLEKSLKIYQRKFVNERKKKSF